MDSAQNNALRAAALGLFLGAGLAGCGLGTAGVVAGSGGTGGSGNSPATIANLQVPTFKTSPATIRLELSDLEGELVHVELSAQVPGVAGLRTLEHVSGPGFPKNGAPIQIPSGGLPLTVEAAWNFSDEDFLPDDGRFVEGVQLLARLGSGAELVLGDDEELSLGNDPPRVTAIDVIIDPDAGEAAGILRVQVTLEDSSDDVVTTLVEYDVVGDLPDAGWQPAVGFGLVDVRASRNGTTLDYFWETNTNLLDLERQVRLRFTPDDGTRDAAGNPVGVGAPLVSADFQVDNNEEPIVQLFNDQVVTNPDQRRGIPIPYLVIDEESDQIDLVFQWRRQEADFPSLDLDANGTLENADLDAILGDPLLRAALQVCSPYPTYAGGSIVPVDADTVRLPELGAAEASILAAGLEGRLLELLRPSSIPAPLSPLWGSNPLVGPVAALPFDEGLTALVLDRLGGSARLLEIELANGALVRQVAVLGPGSASAMGFEGGRQEVVLVATDLGGLWRIERVDLASGVRAELALSDGTEPGPVRGLASLGERAAVFTAGACLFQLDYGDLFAPTVTCVLPDLAAPWDVVVDPLRSGYLYLAERDANRVLHVDLISRSTDALVALTTSGDPAVLERPTQLALEERGSRLLVVTNLLGAARELWGLGLGPRDGNLAFTIGSLTANEVASLEVGRDGLRLLCLPGLDELLGAGGIEQRRTITAHASSTQDVTVAPSFDPAPRRGQRWRMQAENQRLRASATGKSGRFVWDSSEAHSGSVLLRAIGRDTELGIVVESTAAKRVRSPLDVEPVQLGLSATTRPLVLKTADLDSDGDLDIVVGSSSIRNLAVFYQISPGIFDTAPLLLGGTGITDLPSGIATADFDGDGSVDIASANRANFTIFFQRPAGTFDPVPLVVDAQAFNDLSSIAAGDLDGDGDQDLAFGDSQLSNLKVYFQEPPGSFSTAPLVLGDLDTTDSPFSVAAADLNGDGALDLVSANFYGDDLTVFFNDGTGQYDPSPLVLGSSLVTSDPRFVVTADVDGDGAVDVISGNSSGGSHLTIFFQESPGVFSDPPLLLGNTRTTSRPRAAAAADLDGDGDLDLISANAGSNNLAVFFQEEPRKFSPQPLSLADPGGIAQAFGVDASDLNGDGRPDLLMLFSHPVANISDAAVYFQAAPGDLEARAPLVFDVLTPVDVEATDLDGDGDRDLVVANAFGGVTLYFQGAPGSFGEAPLAVSVGGSIGRIATADIDGDGAMDLAVPVGANDHHLAVVFQEEAGSFGAPTIVGGQGTTPSPAEVVVADLDGDGALDLASANERGHNLTLFHQLGGGIFSAVPLVVGDDQTTPSPRSLAAADLNGDGALDLVAGSEDGAKVFFQLQGGGFGSALELPGILTNDYIRSVSAPDIDGDGDRDVLVAHTNFGGPKAQVRLFLQDAPGSFAGTPIKFRGFGVTTQPSDAAAADMDGDGDLDVVMSIVAFHGPQGVRIYYQQAPGIFHEKPLILGVINPQTVVPVDLDGDGDRDLVTATYFPGSISVFWGGH